MGGGNMSKTQVVLRCGYEPCKSFNVARFNKPEDFEEKEIIDPETGEKITVTDPETGEQKNPKSLIDPTFFRLSCNDCGYTTELKIVDGTPKIISVSPKEGEIDV